MFRKITSNRDPDKTLGGELKKEFGRYFGVAGQRSRLMMEKYPRQVFAIMIIAILISGVMAFTIMRQKQKSVVLAKSDPQAVTSGLGQIISTASALQTLWETQQQVDLLLKKDTLTSADSVALNRALAQMESLRALIKKSRPNH